MTGLVSFGLGLGLASIAGFRAFFPLVILGLVTRSSEIIALQTPFKFLGSVPILFLLTLLMAIEFLADKVPAITAFNQLIQIPARIISGGVIFAAIGGGFNLIFALVAGALIAGAMTMVRFFLRGAITDVTGEDNEYFISSVEDILAVTGTILIILAPLLSLAGLTAAILLGYRNFRDRSSTRFSWRV